MGRVLDQTLKLTVSVPVDIHQECAEKIVSYLKSIVRFQYTVLEFSQKWHLHSILCLDVPKDRNNLKRTIWQIVKRYHPDSLFKYAVEFDCLYNNDWYDSYLQKTEDRKVLVDHWDSAKVAECYPSPAEQAKRMDYSANKQVCSSLLADLEGWQKSSVPKTRVGAFQYLMGEHLRQIRERVVMPVFSERRMRERSLLLFRLHFNFTSPLNTDLVMDEITFQSDPSNPTRQIHVPPGGPPEATNRHEEAGCKNTNCKVLYPTWREII